MNTGYIPYPPGAKRFFLRRDLPEEMCFPEYACSTEVQTGTYEAILKRQPLPISSLYDTEIDLQSIQRGRFYSYTGMGCSGTRYCCSVIGDGQFTMPVSRAGLFTDILQRAEKALGKPIAPLLYPTITAEPFPKWLFTSYVILHDTEAESAAVLPRLVALSYLKPSRTKS